MKRVRLFSRDVLTCGSSGVLALVGGGWRGGAGEETSMGRRREALSSATSTLEVSCSPRLAPLAVQFTCASTSSCCRTLACVAAAHRRRVAAMTAPAEAARAAFAESRARFEALVGFLDSDAAAGLQHGELEDQLQADG